MPYPATIIHGDWSKDPKKRMAAQARHLGEGGYLIDALDRFDRLVPRPEALLLFDAPVLAGFDFPIGLPAGFGRGSPFDGFKAFLAGQDAVSFARWGEPAARPGEIGRERPFYPARPGSSSRSHLLAGHGVASIDELLRLCERRTLDRPAACSLFWTLGGNQVGRAAVAGWAEIVRPLAASGQAALWPFDGTLAACLGRFPLTIAETYPADAMRQIELLLPTRWSKRRQDDRRLLNLQLHGIASRFEVKLDKAVAALVDDGFGADKFGEDRFDAFVGLLGMIAVSTGIRAEGAPDRADVTTWEGWIFGQTTPDAAPDGR